MYDRTVIAFRRARTQIAAGSSAKGRAEETEGLSAEILRGAAQSSGAGGRDGAFPVRRDRPPSALDKMGQERYDCDAECEGLHQGARRH